MTDPPQLTCEVCGKEPAVGVAAVPGIPYSAAYGRGCLDADAHPYWVLLANTAMIGGLDAAAEWWKNMVEHTLTHLGKSREDFDRDVAQEIAEQDADMRNYEEAQRALDAGDHVHFAALDQLEEDGR